MSPAAVSGDGAPDPGQEAELRALRARLSRRTTLPISFAEERLWCLDQVDPGSLAFVMAAAARISGPLRPDLLERACGSVVQRQEILRTGFEATAEGRPARRLAAEAQATPELVDLPGVPPAEREQVLVERGRHELTRPFDLACPPLLRLVLLRFDENDWGLVATSHHIVFDHWSTRVFHTEVMAHYEALASGGAADLPPLPIQYVDYAGWQRRRLVGERLASLERHWRERLAGAPVLELPYDRPCSEVRTYAARRISCPVPGEVVTGLKGVAGRAGTTLFMVEVAAFAILLRELSGQDDVLIGCDIANRDRPETESLIGFFVGQLPLRLDLGSCARLCDVVSLARACALDAYAHAELPFERMVAAAGRGRDPRRPPLFQVKLSQSRPGVPPDTRAGLRISPVEIEPSATELELTLILEEGPRGFVATLEHNRDLFDASTIERFLERLVGILSSLARDEQAALEPLPERRRASSSAAERYRAVRDRLRSRSPVRPDDGPPGPPSTGATP